MNFPFKTLTVIILSGLGYFFSAGFGSIWFLMWLAPIPVLIYAYTENTVKVIVVAFIIGLAPGINGIIGYWPTQIPAQDFIVYTLIQSLQWTVVVLLSSILVKKIRTPFSLLAYPVMIGLLEWMQSLGPQGTFNTIAYSQLSFLPAMQIASITGFYGVSFVLSLFASSIAYAFVFHKTLSNSFIVLIFSLSLVLISLMFGYFRIEAYQRNASSTIQVGLASINNPPKLIFNPMMANFLLDEYVPLIQKLKEQGSKVVLLPEEILTVNQSNKAQIKAEFSSLARQNQIILMVGVNEFQNNKRYNSLWVFNAQGALIGTYYKQHLVPGIEAKVTAGINPLSFPLNQCNAGVAICRDMDYPYPARSYGQTNTNILFVPAWDFEVDATVHAAGAITRGIENGYTIVRTARSGYLSVTSPTGEVIAETLAIKNKNNILTVNVPIWLNSSTYAKHKDWFVYVLILGLLLLVVMFIRSFNPNLKRKNL